MKPYRNLFIPFCFCIVAPFIFGCAGDDTLGAAAVQGDAAAPPPPPPGANTMTTFALCTLPGPCRNRVPNGLMPSCATGNASTTCSNSYCVGWIPNIGTTCFPGQTIYCDATDGGHPECNPSWNGSTFVQPTDPWSCGTRDCIDYMNGNCQFGACNAP